MGIVAGALSTLGSLLLSHQQQEQNENMWDKQNEYNKPVNQIRRLREAGLNPATLLAQGSVDNVNSSPPQSADMSAGLSAASESFLNSLTMSNLKEQNKNLKMQNDVLKEDARSKQLDNDLKEVENRNEREKLDAAFNSYVNIDSDGKISYGSLTPDGEFVPMFDDKGDDNPHLIQLLYRNTIRDAIKEGFEVDRTYLLKNLDNIENAIKEEYGKQNAHAVIEQLKASANESNENAHAVRLDNEIFDNLGLGSKTMLNLLIRVLTK